MNLISAVIVEDEIPIAKSLEALLSQSGKINVLGLAHNVEDAYELISSTKPQLVLCDIQLSKSQTGFDLLKQFTNPDFKLIFITAYNNYAIKAFKFNAIDYLLKPVDENELFSAIDRVVKQIGNNVSDVQLQNLLSLMSNSESNKPKKILFKTSEQIRAININEIVRLESESNYTSVYLADNKKLLVSKPLKEYSDILEDRNFFRAHQSHLINLDFFELYEKQDGGYIVLKDGTNIPVSKRKKNLLFELLEQL